MRRFPMTHASGNGTVDTIMRQTQSPVSFLLFPGAAMNVQGMNVPRQGRISRSIQGFVGGHIMVQDY